MPADARQRLAYIDWMRGFACLMMFQTHCYDSWLSPAAKQSTFDKLSQLGGTLPAPLFLFLAGISLAMTTDRMRERGASAGKIARATIRRGGEILALGLLFRLQMFVLGQGHPPAPWTDLLRVDILNMIGASIMAMGVMCWCVGKIGAAANSPAFRTKMIWTAAGIALGISLVTPPLYNSWRPRFLPWFLESYVNGVHIFDKPQPWLFPFFPWAGFAFAGLAVGFFLITDWARAQQAKALRLVAAAGTAIAGFALLAAAQPLELYAEYDFWHTSPSFFLIRVGVLLAILWLSYVWCRWGPGLRGFSPLVQMGKTSLLVYWVHINFVYTGLSIMERHTQSILSASVGLLIIFTSMVLLSLVRTSFKARKGAAQV
ncbi:MAG: heparan-alpha-glucosaminide N-acetyltransferase domain-containing protein [Candidatus Acidiferrales bacterium]